MGQPIHFYHQDRAFGFFSNFSPHPIKLKGLVWPTSEHYFQAQKFAGTDCEEEVRLVKRPLEAARLGRDHSKPLRKDWEQIKDGAMREALWAKFTQHPQLKAHLLGTGAAQLVEHTANDSYWGDGGDGSGRNMLGQLLMETRERLRADG